MVPKALHGLSLVDDDIDLPLGYLNNFRIAELLRGVFEARYFGLELFDLFLDVFETLESLIPTSVVFIDIALLHGLDVALELFIKLGYSSSVLLCLVVD